jgi:hypothetical protein
VATSTTGTCIAFAICFIFAFGFLKEHARTTLGTNLMVRLNHTHSLAIHPNSPDGFEFPQFNKASRSTICPYSSDGSGGSLLGKAVNWVHQVSRQMVN